MKHLIRVILISLLFSGVAFGEEATTTGELVADSAEVLLEPQNVEFWFGTDSKTVALLVINYNKCYDSERCRITIAFPDGSRTVIVWSADDKPIKIEMEPLSDADYIKELEEKVKMLNSRSGYLTYPFMSPTPAITLENMPNAKE